MRGHLLRGIRERIAEANRAADHEEERLEESRARRITVEREVGVTRYHSQINHLSDLFEQIVSGRG